MCRRRILCPGQSLPAIGVTDVQQSPDVRDARTPIHGEVGDRADESGCRIRRARGARYSERECDQQEEGSGAATWHDDSGLSDVTIHDSICRPEPVP